MIASPGTLVVDELHFEVRRSARRRTLQITVDRAGELIVSAPSDCPESEMADFVREKRFWIYGKLAQKEALLREKATPLTEQRFVDGAGFPYLGRHYRLRLVDAQAVPVRLLSGRFVMCRDAVADGRSCMIRWYSEHARVWLGKRVAEHAKRVAVEPAGVTVQDLGYRWGSCGKGGRLYFHWKSILLPASIVEYLVVHELVHLREANHTPAFWRRVERVLPDYATRKQWLAENASALVPW